jgi:hypothetical protein
MPISIGLGWRLLSNTSCISCWIGGRSEEGIFRVFLSVQRRAGNSLAMGIGVAEVLPLWLTDKQISQR